MPISFPNESAEYRAAREHLLASELELRRHMEAVARERRALPPGGLVPEDYLFDGLGTDGMPTKVRLSELFAPGKDTLVIYNYMFPRMHQDTRPGPSAGHSATLPLTDTPCPSCTALLDTLDPVALHAHQNVNFVVIAQTPLERLVTFAGERGWRHHRLVSSAGTTFKRDYHAQSPEGDQLPMLTVFQRTPDGIRHFYSSEMMFAPTDPGQNSRHVGPIESLWNLFDYTPNGRPSDWHEQLDYAQAAASCCHK